MSNLADIRSMVMELSGRFDLDDAEAAVNLDQFIKAGQRTLDKMLDGGKAFARYAVELSYQQILIQVPNARSLTEIWLYKGDKRVKLERVKLLTLKEYYDEKTTSITPGVPQYWSPVNVRPYPLNVLPTSFSQEWAFDEIVESGSDQVNGILLMPPCDLASTYTLEISGKFWSEMPDDADGTSYWISQEPLLLTYATLYHLETSHRNTEGAKDWMNTIVSEISELNKDIFEEEDISQMEG